MENKIYTTLAIQGYDEVQLWHDGTITYKDASGKYVPLSEHDAVLEVLNIIKDPTEIDFTSIKDVNDYIAHTGDKSFEKALSNILEEEPETDYTGPEL